MAFFTPSGRLRRRAYFLRVLALYALGIVVYAIPGLIYQAEIPPAITIGALVGFLLIGYLVVIQVLLRLHDLDLDSWWAFVMVLPVVSYVLGGGLQFVQGSVGPNRFGLDTKRPGMLPPTLVVPEGEPST